MTRDITSIVYVQSAQITSQAEGNMMSTNNIRKKMSVAAAFGATVLAAGALVGQMFAAPTAHANRTVSAHEICSEHGQVAKVKWFPPPFVGYCAHPMSILPGNTFLYDGDVPIEWKVPPGSYKVNPLDPLSDWVIPD